MRRISARLLILAAVAFLAACAGTPAQTVSLAPEVKAPSGNVGHGKALAFKVEDDRADKKIIGYRDTEGGRTAPITLDGDLPAIVGKAAERPLKELGFDPVPFKQGAPLSLTITIRELEYKAQTTGMTKKVSAKCVLAARVVNGAGGWEGSFPVAQEKEVMTAPGENENAKFINDVLSNSLSMLLSDPELVQYLGREPIQPKMVQ